MRDSARSFLRMPIFSAFDSSLSPILGLDPITDDGGIGVRGLGPLSSGAGGGAGRGRASFAHSGSAQQELCGNGDEREASLEQNARKKMTAAE
jgi:hypothetical protein